MMAAISEPPHIEKRQSASAITTVDANGNTIISTLGAGSPGGAATSLGSTRSSPDSSSSPTSKRQSLRRSTQSHPQHPKPTPAPDTTQSAGHVSDQRGSQELTIGAKAGIAVGIVIIVLAVILGPALARRRRRQIKNPLGRVAIDEKLGMTSRWDSKKGRSLPMWKSELAGESHVVELDASSEMVRPELDNMRSPTELVSNNEITRPELSGVEIPAELELPTITIEHATETPRLDAEENEVRSNNASGG